MPAQQRIEAKLTEVFRPARLEVVNESHLHAGHANSPGTGESHFRVLVVSDAFKGKSRVERHRMVNSALDDELAGGVHALAVKAMTPEEAAAG